LVQEISASSKKEASGAEEISGAIQQLSHVIRQSAEVVQNLWVLQEDFHRGLDEDIMKIADNIRGSIAPKRKTAASMPSPQMQELNAEDRPNASLRVHAEEKRDLETQ
jgi:hypothetical protein